MKLLSWLEERELQKQMLTIARPAVGKLFAHPAAVNDNAPAAVLNPADWQGQAIPEREWHVEGLIPSRTVTLMSGDGGKGKSLLALQLAAATALGRCSAGFSPAKGRALYVGAEDEAQEFQRRLADIADSMGAEFRNLGDMRLISLADRDALLASPDRAGTMQPTPLWHRVRTVVEEFKPRFIVLDTSADLFGGDEIKRAQVRQFVAMLRSLAIETNSAVLLLSHPSVSGMASGAGTSGSTAWSNSVRSRLYLEDGPAVDGVVDPASRRLSVKKANYGETGQTFDLRWSDGVFRSDVDVSPLVTKASEERLNNLFLDLFDKVAQQGRALSPSRSQSYAPSVLIAHPEARGTSRKQLVAAMERLLATGMLRVVQEGPPSRRYNRLIRASELAPSHCLRTPSNSS